MEILSLQDQVVKQILNWRETERRKWNCVHNGCRPVHHSLASEAALHGFAAYKSAIFNIRFPDSGRSKVSAIAVLKSPRACTPPIRTLNSGPALMPAISSRNPLSSGRGGLKK